MSRVCRTCLKVIENGSQLFSLEINEPAFDTLHIKTKLETCVPEIIVHRVRNSVICSFCLYALNTAYEFKTRCLQTETRIYDFMTRETLDSIDLNNYIKRNPNIMAPSCDTLNRRNIMNRESSMMLSPPPPLPPLQMVLQSMPPQSLPSLSSLSHPPPPHPSISQMLPPLPSVSQSLPLLSYVPQSLQSQSLQHQPPTYHHSGLLPRLLAQPPPQPPPPLPPRPPPRPPAPPQQMYAAQPSVIRYRIVGDNSDNMYVLPIDNINTPSFKCTVCQHNFSSNDLLREHMSCHINPEGLKCSMCEFQTNSTSSLDEHLKSHNGLATIEQYCMTVPMATTPTTNENTYKCSNCEYKTTDKAAFKEHRAIHVSEQVHQCGLCNFRSTHSSSLRRHMKVHMGDRPYRCNECRYGAADEAALQIHIQIHSKDRPFKCSECSYTALKNSKLKHHMVRVHPDKIPNPFYDPQHVNEADSPPTQNENVNHNHTNNKRLHKDPYQVSIDDIHSILQEEDDSSNSQGGNALDTMLDDNELEVGANVDPYMVTVADIQQILEGKSIDEPEDMTYMDNGIDNGENAKVYRCSICRQPFKFQYLLRRHMNIHSNNNKTPMECTKCDFRTIIKSHWLVHMKIHSGGKIYRCDRCPYSTVYWSNMQKHNRVHTGEKPYKCTMCDYTTTKNSSLKNHIMNLHNDTEPFKCPECPYSTDNEETLLGHIELHSMGNHFIDNVTSSTFIEDTINNINNPFTQEDTGGNEFDQDMVGDDLEQDPMSMDVIQDSVGVNDFGQNDVIEHTMDNNVEHELDTHATDGNFVQDAITNIVIQNIVGNYEIDNTEGTIDDHFDAQTSDHFIQDTIRNEFDSYNTGNNYVEDSMRNEDVVDNTIENEIITDDDFIREDHLQDTNLIQRSMTNDHIIHDITDDDFVHEDPVQDTDIIQDNGYVMTNDVIHDHVQDTDLLQDGVVNDYVQDSVSNDCAQESGGNDFIQNAIEDTSTGMLVPDIISNSCNENIASINVTEDDLIVVSDSETT